MSCATNDSLVNQTNMIYTLMKENEAYLSTTSVSSTSVLISLIKFVPLQTLGGPLLMNFANVLLFAFHKHSLLPIIKPTTLVPLHLHLLRFHILYTMHNIAISMLSPHLAWMINPLHMLYTRIGELGINCDRR